MCVKFSLALALSGALLSSSASAEEAGPQACPIKPIGVIEVSTGPDAIFFATASVVPFSTQAESAMDAKNDAKLAARLLLKKDRRIPKTQSNRLVGVIDIGDCQDGGKMFATVSVSVKSAQQAAKVADQISNSMKKSPTPASSSYSRVEP